MRITRSSLLIAGLAITSAFSGTAEAAFVTFGEGGNSTTASIQDTVDLFRTAVGNPNNGNAAGPLASGRREINWDGGGGVSTSTVSPTPFTGFLDTRGALFTTPSPGNGFIQATPDGLATQFNNPTYSSIFNDFSPLRLFTPIGSNITDVTFFVPGTNGAIPATVAGFGAIFTDVDLLGSTRLDFFSLNNTLLFSGNVAPGTVSDASFSFLGAVANAGEQIARVRITSGNSALGPNDTPTTDVVAMDDFIYSEPTAIPEPTSLVLLGLGLAGVVLVGRRKAARHPAG